MTAPLPLPPATVPPLAAWEETAAEAAAWDDRWFDRDTDTDEEN
ncbi:hypothetical protein ACFC08_17720 [Streptomyces sp. NPDC056112]